MKTKIFFILSIAWYTVSAQTNVNIQVDALLGNKTISPYIFGKNNNISDNQGTPTTATEWQLMRDAGLRFTRENGGNNATKYNWRLKFSSHPDWYNNVYAHDWDYAAKKLQDSLPGVQGMWAFQLIGKAAKTTTQNFNDWNYNNSSGWSGTCQNLAGGGVPNTNGGCTAQTGGNINLYLENWTADSTTGILQHWFGTGGLGYNKEEIIYWSMDNEPEIWNGTHDDVMATQPTAEAFMQLYFAVAEKARAAYPNIKLCGPVPATEWQWYSWNNNKITVGGSSYVWLQYFIKRCAEEQTASGIRLLDVIDIHNYPNESADADIVQLRRMYFDTTYNYPGANGVKTTSASGWDNTITNENVFGRCNKWLDQYMGTNHGVTFGVSEYGATNNNANVTSVSYASVLGTFADNNVAYFAPWYWYPGMWETLHLFSRYSRSTRVQSISDNENDVSAYSSINSAKDSMTVILVNRSLTAIENTTVTVSNFTVTNGNCSTLQLKQLPGSETFISHTNNALNAGTVPIVANTFTISLAPLSTTAVMLKKQAVLTTTITPTPTVTTTPTTTVTPTAIREQINSIDAITIYPNPGDGLFYFNASSVSINSIEVYNVMGEKIYQAIINGKSQHSIDLSKEKNGIYFVHFISDKGIVVKKIVINN